MRHEHRNLNSGLALTFLALLAFAGLRSDILLHLAIILLILSMSAPSLFAPFARIWHPLSEAAGKIFLTVFLAAVFTTLVIPVAFVRKLMGKDPLKLSRRDQSISFFPDRQHCYVSADLENPY